MKSATLILRNGGSQSPDRRLKGPRNNHWQRILRRDTLVWIYDRTFLGSGKEGMAVGGQGIYLKTGTQNTVSIAADRIFSITGAEGVNGIAVHTDDGCTFVCEIAELKKDQVHNFTELLSAYVQYIQLVQETEKRNLPKGTSSGNGARFCTNCGKPIQENANFCIYCGQKAV